ncbi:MAG: PAS domain S-box protein [Proteobacteria bacterium]|nr:PAS domain S-box protein [Pseudomonadota bacterium]
MYDTKAGFQETLSSVIGHREGRAPWGHRTYGRLIESLQDGVIRVDGRGIIREANRRCCQMWGFAHEEIAGHKCSDFLSELSLETLRRQVSSLSSPAMPSFALTWLGEHGDPVHTQTSLIPLDDDPAGECGYLAVMSKIGRDDEAEQALKKSEANLKAILNNSLQYFVLLDRQGRVQASNRVARQRAMNYLGFVMKIGDPFQRFVVDEVKELFEREFSRALDGEQVRRAVKLRDSAGEYYWVEVNLNPVWTEDERVEGVCLSLLDVTERKMAENALRDSEEQYRLLVENSSNAILITSQLKITFVNATGARLLGAGDLDELIGRSILDFVTPVEKQAIGECLLQIADQLPHKPLLERKIVRVDGSEIYAEVVAVPFTRRGQRAVQLVIRDITQHKRAEAALLSYQQQLRHLASECSLSEEKARRRIATELHDRIGTSLSLAKIQLESFIKGCAEQQLVREIDKVHDLIEGALTHTRSLTLELSPPVLYELGLKEAIAWLADQVKLNYGLEVISEINEDCRHLDDDIRGVVFRAVRELLINVVKHANADRAFVSMRRRGQKFEIEVEDRGIGFSPFEAAPGVRQGGGFGLFSIKERLGHLGGGMEIDSLPGLGTRVILTAPFGEAP